MLNRRNFIQFSLAAGMSLGFSGLVRPVHAANAFQGKKLIVVNLFGGCDTANAFPPFQENNYYDIRPTLAVPEEQVMTLSGSDLGLHPSLAPLQDIWNAGHMALFPAAHCGPDPDRSHFYQLDLYDGGGYTEGFVPDGKGWMARLVDARFQQSTGIEALDMDDFTKIFLNPSIPVLSVVDPQSAADGTGPNAELATKIVNHLNNLNQSKTRSGMNAAFAETQDILLDRYATLGALDYTVTPANGAAYPNSKLGQQLRQAAVLLRNLPELEIIHLVRGGWDTHSKQGSTGDTKQPQMLSDVGNSLRAFYDDLGAERDNVAIVVHTEFGRTAQENGSQGTDHGQAGAWFVIGGNNVTGGQHGQWPGFGVDDLSEGRYTLQTTDYRDIFSQVLVNHLEMTQSSTEAIFPGYSYNQNGPVFI